LNAIALSSPSIQLSSGNFHTCAAKGQKIFCWGGSAEGKLNVPIDAVPPFVAGPDYTCAATVTKKVKCWGSDFGNISDVPKSVVDPVQLAGGMGHVCALLRDGDVVCWGRDFDKTNETNVPPDIFNATKIAVGADFACALIGKDIKCWGLHRTGSFPPPDSLRNATDIDATSDALGAIVDRGVALWAKDLKHRDHTPADLGKPRQISLSYFHACGISEVGAARCWGTSVYGQPIPPPADVVSPLEIVAGLHHSCALLRDGAVKCWGYNGSGQLNVPPELGGK
jgi:alpha-tubulin suppressor-like RCC1 family protein